MVFSQKKKKDPRACIPLVTSGCFQYACNITIVHCAQHNTCTPTFTPTHILDASNPTTHQVRSTETAPHAHINVPTLVFDRVLIYLEALALGKPPPSYAAHLLHDILSAAQHLSIHSLQSYCREKLGNQEKRVRCWTADQVRHANANGQCLLTMDGMVLDVTNWLSEHPGGMTIIPAQALNVDSCRFFEVWGLWMVWMSRCHLGQSHMLVICSILLHKQSAYTVPHQAACCTKQHVLHALYHCTTGVPFFTGELSVPQGVLLW